jgi:hypothetical protein
MRIAWIAVAVLAAGFVLASCDSSKGPSAGGSAELTPAADDDPQADQVLRAMCDLLESAKAMKFHVTAESDERSASGLMVSSNRQVDVLMRRPDCLVAHAHGAAERTLWYHGKTLTILDGTARQWARIEVPGTMDEMFDSLFENYGLTVPLADLLFQDAYKDLTEQVQTGQYVGQDTVSGRLCHHLLFEQANVDWQVWIDAGEKPLPRKVVITHKNEPGDPAYTAHLDGWDLSPTVPADAFDARPPSDAKSVDMQELLKREGH